jgi:peptide/histidine transporter 3/4
LIGLILVVTGAVPGDTSPALFFLAIYVIALGTGGIKPNVSTMGADQFDDRYSQDRKEKGSFFNWFYWSINLGSLISHTLVSYICQYGIPALGGEDWGFFVGYLIPCTTMAMAIVVFLIGSPRYRKQKPSGSVLATAFSICYEAVWTNSSVTGTIHVLDKAKKMFGGHFSDKQVEGVKLVTRLSPFLLAMIPYWGIYSQMYTTFQNQGCQMDLHIGTFMVPMDALTCFDTITILLLVPLFDGYIYPTLKKKGYPLSMLQKIGKKTRQSILFLLLLNQLFFFSFRNRFCLCHRRHGHRLYRGNLSCAICPHSG